MEASLTLIGSQKNPTKGLPKRMQKSCFKISAKSRGRVGRLDARPAVRHSLAGRMAVHPAMPAVHIFCACRTVVRGGARSCDPSSCFSVGSSGLCWTSILP